MYGKSILELGYSFNAFNESIDVFSLSYSVNTNSYEATTALQRLLVYSLPVRFLRSDGKLGYGNCVIGQ